jgi:hypothetical protein
LLQTTCDLQQNSRILLQVNEPKLQIMRSGLPARNHSQHPAEYVLQISLVLLQVSLDSQHIEDLLQQIIPDLLQVNEDSHQILLLGGPVPESGKENGDDGSPLSVVLQQDSWGMLQICRSGDRGRSCGRDRG